MTIANTPLHIICGACGCNKELDYAYVKGKFGEPDEVYISCGNCKTIATLSDVIPVRKTEKIPEDDGEDEVEYPPLPACASCVVPALGMYTQCKHIGLAIRESEFDVLPGSRRCSNFRGPGQGKKDERESLKSDPEGCWNCGKPGVDYLKCWHIAEAIQESEYDVHCDYRKCSHYLIRDNIGKGKQ